MTTPEIRATVLEAERLFFACETEGNLERAEALLVEHAHRAREPRELATLYGELAQAQFLRFEQAPAGARRAIAEKGLELAKQALAYDPRSVEANAWAAALMGVHGLEMGILSTLFYVGEIRARAETLLELDETYHMAMAHQILGDLYRLTPPKPIGMRDYAKAREHLTRARALAPSCPQAKLRLAELHLTLRKPALAREELERVLVEPIEERGPRYAEQCRARARELTRRLPASAKLDTEAHAS